MRICSFVPSGTEILYALGLQDEVVGVSHECDYPPDALRKPKVLHADLDHDRLTSRQIDEAVRDAMQHHRSLYRVDAEALRRAAPDLVVTQQLCEVCAIDAGEVIDALRLLPRPPRVVSLHPHTLEEALEEIRLVGEMTGRRQDAERLLEGCRARLARVGERAARRAARPRIFCLEWLSPLMASGHWVPEQVALAGGIEVLGRAGEASRYVTPEEVVAAAPEVLVVMPCGFSIERTRRELSVVTAQPWWPELPAVRDRRAYLVDGPAYFNRSGPRLIDGVELLADLLEGRLADHDSRVASAPL